jgi:hypothetical protein
VYLCHRGRLWCWCRWRRERGRLLRGQAVARPRLAVRLQLAARLRLVARLLVVQRQTRVQELLEESKLAPSLYRERNGMETSCI